MSVLSVVVHASEAGHEVVNEIPGEPWMYGIGAFVTLVILLFLITRLNVTR